MSLTAERFTSRKVFPFCTRYLDITTVTISEADPSEFWIRDLEFRDAVYCYYNLAGFYIAFSGDIVVAGGDGNSITSSTSYSETLAVFDANGPSNRRCRNLGYAATVAVAATAQVEQFYEISEATDYTVSFYGNQYQGFFPGDASVLVYDVTQQANQKYTFWFRIYGSTTVSSSPVGGSINGGICDAAIGGIYSGMGGGGIQGLAGGVRITASLSSISILSGTIDTYMYALDRFGTGSYGDSYISGSGTITDFTPIFYVYD